MLKSNAKILYENSFFILFIFVQKNLQSPNMEDQRQETILDFKKIEKKTLKLSDWSMVWLLQSICLFILIILGNVSLVTYHPLLLFPISNISTMFDHFIRNRKRRYFSECSGKQDLEICYAWIYEYIYYSMWSSNKTIMWYTWVSLKWYTWVSLKFRF